MYKIQKIEEKIVLRTPLQIYYQHFFCFIFSTFTTEYKSQHFTSFLLFTAVTYSSKPYKSHYLAKVGYALTYIEKLLLFRKYIYHKIILFLYTETFCYYYCYCKTRSNNSFQLDIIWIDCRWIMD